MIVFISVCYTISKNKNRLLLPNQRERNYFGVHQLFFQMIVQNASFFLRKKETPVTLLTLLILLICSAIFEFLVITKETKLKVKTIRMLRTYYMPYELWKISFYIANRWNVFTYWQYNLKMKYTIVKSSNYLSSEA